MKKRIIEYQQCPRCGGWGKDPREQDEDCHLCRNERKIIIKEEIIED